MKIYALALTIAAGCCAAAQDGWKNPRVISATVVERYAEQPERSVEVVQQEGALSYRTTAAINGELAGTPRIEVAGPSGVFTWIEGKPEVALQLFAPTSMDVFEYFERPRFSRADLEFNLQGIEKALGKKVLVGKTETIAERDCLTLRVLDRPDGGNSDYQKLWVDRETGITMKQQDFFAGKKTFEREVTKMDFSASADGFAFAPAAGAKVLRGLISPLALLKMGQLSGLSEFRSDIAKINEGAKPQTAWASVFDADSQFAYCQTVAREIRNNPVNVVNNQQSSSSNNAASRNNQRRQNQFGQRQGRFVSGGQGGQPRSVQIVVMNEDFATVALDDDHVAKAFTIEVDQNGNRRVTQVNSGATGAQGSQTSGASATGQGASSGAAATQAKSFPFAQSDFVHPETGDTLSLLQVSGRPIEASLGQLILGPPTKVEKQGLDSAKYYSVAQPIKLNVLTWKQGDVSYALVSTSLGSSALQELASKVKKP
jgi:hypothetical protein